MPEIGGGHQKVGLFAELPVVFLKERKCRNRQGEALQNPAGSILRRLKLWVRLCVHEEMSIPYKWHWFVGTRTNAKFINPVTTGK